MKIWINKTVEMEPADDFKDGIIFDMLDESPKSNLKVDFEEIWRRFGDKRLESIYEDLITVAASVYAADKRVPRSGIDAGDVEDNWTRKLVVSIPVLDYERWIQVKSEFENALNFLSGDKWEFHFRKTELQFRSSTTKKKYKVINGAFDAVSLFSGGLDSYSGAINQLEQGKNICFVGCREYYALSNRINNLFGILKENYPDRDMDVVVFNADPGVPRNINQSLRSRYNENTSRSRSLLFLSVAIAVASLIGGDIPVYIPENGFIGLNVPLTPSRMGSCSTRTTHVYFIKQLNSILQVLHIPHKIENFFVYKTKGEIVQSVMVTNAFKIGAGKTTDLKAVLLSLHNYLRYGTKDYYTKKLIALGGMNMYEIEKFVDVYIHSMEEMKGFIKEQAQFNGNDLLKYIEGSIDE